MGFAADVVWFEANMRPATALLLLLTQYAYEKDLDGYDALRLVMDMLGTQQPTQNSAPSYPSLHHRLTAPAASAAQR